MSKVSSDDRREFHRRLEGWTWWCEKKLEKYSSPVTDSSAWVTHSSPPERRAS